MGNNLGSETIVLLRDLKTPSGMKGILYYYKGNFFYPMELYGHYGGLVKRAMREFSSANTALIERDRAQSDYKTKPELFKEWHD